jgi:rRNA maturation endonuclease Nob1
LAIDNEQFTIGDAPAEEEPVLKVCYYCGKKVSADAPRCETCGNDRSFTWTKKTSLREN